MKVGALVAIVIAGLLLAWIAGAHMLRGGMTVDDRWASAAFERQLPKHGENDSATRIFATAERFGDFHDVRPALRDSLRGEPLSPPAAQFLEKQANVIGTLRAEIISNPPPRWAIDARDIFEGPEPPLSLHLQLYTVLGADALLQHERGSDRAAWSDLRAISILADSLRERPEVWSLTIALTGHRIVREVSAKLGSPPPPTNPRPPLLRAIEYEAWATRTRAERYPAGEPDGSQFDDTVRRIVTPILRPIRLAQAELEISRMRRLSTTVARTPPCSPLPTPDLPAWAPLFERINRLGRPSECGGSAPR